jgi:radical SAM superfamily enzyme YgiQ (UPF0313 family)
MRKADAHILLVNPWIHDFAAYDFWAKPLGLLTLGGILRRIGCTVSYLDCLDRFHPDAPAARSNAKYGRGPYRKVPIRKPPGLADVPRVFSRYGISPESFRNDLLSLPRPDLILVTSMMTYWYGGVKETVASIRGALPDIPVILGGIYATLCNRHARRTIEADEVVSGRGEEALSGILKKYAGISPPPFSGARRAAADPLPAWELERRMPYVPLLTSTGCPFACPYCASRALNPVFRRRPPESVVAEVAYWHARHGVRDFVLYDDAFLYAPEDHAHPILEGVIRSGLSRHVRFHTPNALHIRFLDRETARLLFAAGFKTISLGLESTHSGSVTGEAAKASFAEFRDVVKRLDSAGFERNAVGAYLLMGLPGQDMKHIERDMEAVLESGATPLLAYYSPIPGTPLWEKATRVSRYDLSADPIYTNNSIFPCLEEPLPLAELSRLNRVAKGFARGSNS